MELFRSYSIVLLLSLIVFTNQQYIATSDDYNKVAINLIDDYQYCFGAPLLTALKRTSFNNIKTDTVLIKNIKAMETNPNVEDSYADLESNSFIISPLKLSLSFSFTYKVGEGPEKKGELEMSFFDMIFRIESEDGQFKIINYDSKYRQKDFKVYAESNQTLLKSAFYGALPKIKESLEAPMSFTIGGCYENKVAKKQPFIFTSNSLLGKRTVPIHLNALVGYCQDHAMKQQSAICYYSGNASDRVDRSVKKQVLANKWFMTYSGYKKLFINYKLFTDIIAKMNKDKEIILPLNHTSPIAKDLPYQFTVKSLRSIVTDAILKPYVDDDAYNITSKVKNVALNGDMSTIEMSSSFNIKDKLDVISIDYSMKFTFGFEVGSTRPLFNICIGNIFGLINSTVKPIDAIKDKALLEKWQMSTLSLASKHRICLADDAINLRDYFKGPFRTFDVHTYGIYLEGENLF